VAVSGEFRIDVRPYAGYDDPSLPVAAWIGQAGIAGDVSGGNVIIDFLFQRANDAQISELFNLEQMTVDTTADASQEVLMQTVAMDTLAPNRPASDQLWSLNTDGLLGSVSALLLDRGNGLPLWLGAPNRVEGNGVLRFTMANTNLRLYAITVQGYMWGPRSVMAPGGPRRPIGGLFRG